MGVRRQLLVSQSLRQHLASGANPNRADYRCLSHRPQVILVQRLAPSPRLLNPRIGAGAIWRNFRG